MFDISLNVLCGHLILKWERPSNLSAVWGLMGETIKLISSVGVDGKDHQTYQQCGG